MSELFQLFIQFFNIGIFSFGGGYATLPFLYDISEKYNWYTISQLTDMLSLSSITPGPIGINMATFAGFSTAGIFGSVIATTAIILPSYLIVSFVYKILNKFSESQIVKGAIKSLKPAGCALLSSVGIKLLFTSNLNLLGGIILVFLITLSFYSKRDPIFYLGLSAFLGILLGYFNLIGI